MENLFQKRHSIKHLVTRTTETEQLQQMGL